MTEHTAQDTLFDVPPSVYVLTIRQPWAWAIVAGHKRVENRPRYSTHRGLLLVHTADKRFDDHGLDVLAAAGIDVPAKSDFVRGAIIGRARMYDCVNDSSDPFAVDGQWHYLLDEPVETLEPVFMPGKLPMWRPPADWQAWFAG